MLEAVVECPLQDGFVKAIGWYTVSRLDLLDDLTVGRLHFYKLMDCMTRSTGVLTR